MRLENNTYSAEKDLWPGLASFMYHWGMGTTDHRGPNACPSDLKTFYIPNMIEYLKQYKEEIPSWLKNYQKGDKISFITVMDGRIGYYPGSGTDDNLVTVANRAQCVHTFLYVDYIVKKEELVSMLDSGAFRGYHTIDRIEWSAQDVMFDGPCPIPVNYRLKYDPMHFVDRSVTPYCFTEILERNPEMSEEWGADRFCITFLFADGIATYYQLFIKQLQKAPWMFLLQDHGFGCNYDKFSKGKLLDKLIEGSGIRPEYVICATGPNTSIWDGYRRIAAAKATYGGMHQSERLLYQKQ